MPSGRRQRGVRSRLRGPVRHQGAADRLGRVRLAVAPADPRQAGDAARGHHALRHRLRGRRAGPGRRDLRLRPEDVDEGGHAGRAGRSLHDRGCRADRVPEGRRAQRGLCDAARRRERALRRDDPDPLDRLDGAVPGERARVPAGPRGAGRASGPPRQQVPLRRLRRRRRVVALGGEGLRRRPRGLPAGHQDLAARPDPRQPAAAGELPERGRRSRLARDPGEPARHHDQLPEPEGSRRPQRPRARLGLVPGRQVGGALGEAGREGARAGSVFSWGWQEWNKKEMDPDKPKAACVWLWGRTRSLCNAPRMLGKGFNRSADAQGRSSCRTASSAAPTASAPSAAAPRLARGTDRRPRRRPQRAVRAARRGIASVRSRATPCSRRNRR